MFYNVNWQLQHGYQVGPTIVLKTVHFKWTSSLMHHQTRGRVRRVQLWRMVVVLDSAITAMLHQTG